jgi:hypothetical protein
MRPFVLAMAGPSEPRPTSPGGSHDSTNGNGGRPRKVATWFTVIGPIAAYILGFATIAFEVVERINDPAAFGVGLTLVVGGKFADVLAELRR